MAKTRWLIVLMVLLGCDLADPQGPGMQWERTEQQRLDALEGKVRRSALGKCGGGLSR